MCHVSCQCPTSFVLLPAPWRTCLDIEWKALQVRTKYGFCRVLPILSCTVVVVVVFPVACWVLIIEWLPLQVGKKLTWVPSQSSQSNQSRVIVCVAPSHLSHVCRLTVLITVSLPLQVKTHMSFVESYFLAVLLVFCLFVFLYIFCFSLTHPWPWFTSLDHRVITVTGEN